MHAAIAGLAPANAAGVSYVYRDSVDVQAVTTGHRPSFLWFTREGKAYLVTDPASLARVGALHAPPAGSAPDPGGESVGERLRQLADELVTSGAARPFDQ